MSARVMKIMEHMILATIIPPIPYGKVTCGKSTVRKKAMSSTGAKSSIPRADVSRKGTM